jgi:uncharacterized protein YlxW (UPF0749 family)
MAVVVSHHDEVEPGPSGFSPVVVELAVLLAIVITAAVVAAWKSPQIDDAQQTASQTSAELAASQQHVHALETQVASLEAERDRLHGDIAQIQARLEHVVLQAGGLEGDVGSLRSNVADLTAKLRAANHDLRSVTAALDRAQAELADTRGQRSAAHQRGVVAAGPALADGRYLGSIVGIDTSRAPWRLAMRVTARSTGVPLANPGWRVFVVAPFASVTLTTWRDGRTVNLRPWQFEKVFDGAAPSSGKLRSARYWIRLGRGRVISFGDVAPRNG